jgi:hypothetical protein
LAVIDEFGPETRSLLSFRKREAQRNLLTLNPSDLVALPRFCGMNREHPQTDIHPPASRNCQSRGIERKQVPLRFALSE